VLRGIVALRVAPSSKVTVYPESFAISAQETLMDLATPLVAVTDKDPGVESVNFETVTAIVVVVVKASPEVPEFSVAVTVYEPLSAVVAAVDNVTTPVDELIVTAGCPLLLIEYETDDLPPEVAGVVE
jgi:hypothetical protein